MGKRAFAPLPNRPQLVAVYPALFNPILSPPDIDECRQSPPPCDGSHVCVNTEGGFSCRCPRGTTEINGKCEKNKQFTGYLRATNGNFTNALKDPTSFTYAAVSRAMTEEVRANGPFEFILLNLSLSLGALSLKD